MSTRTLQMWRRIASIATVIVALTVSGASAVGAHSSRGSRVRPHGAAPASAAATPSRPNILLMISDDQTWSMFNRSLMPNVYSQLVDHGTLFDRAYVNTPLCCPSRSQIFTGLYATNTNVDSNSDPLTRPTLIQALRDSGYRTLLAGKYLNSHPCTTPLPEFDEWYCYGKENSSEKNPVVSIGGTEKQMTGYSADIFANFVKHFIATTPVDQPFFAIYSPKDPHFPANDDRFDNIEVPLHRPPSFNEDTTADNKPAYVQRGPLTAAEIATIDTTYTKMYRSSRGVDNAVGSILSTLGSRAPNTIVYFISDNGLMLGEHRIPSGKVVPYEESARVPMVVRNPLVPSASHPVLSHALVENVDIAPTIAEQAGITWRADGRSLTPLLDGSAKTIRGTALIEACTKDTGAACWTPGLDTQKPRYFGMETNRYKYVEYQTGERELYDLTVDPYELVNHAGTAGWESTQTILANLLANLTAVPVPDTTIVTGPSGVVIPGPKTFTYFSQAFASTYRCRLSTAASPGQWAPCNGGRLTTGSLGDGMYTFSVQGTDSGGTDATPATRSFTVDSTAPIVVVGNGANKVIGGDRFSAFKITLFRASSHAVSVKYATSDFVAQSPSDFTAQAGVATIPAGSLSTFVNVAIAAGATPNETFHLRLRSPVGATLGIELATGNTGAP